MGNFSTMGANHQQCKLVVPKNSLLHTSDEKNEQTTLVHLEALHPWKVGEFQCTLCPWPPGSTDTRKLAAAAQPNFL